VTVRLRCIDLPAGASSVAASPEIDPGPYVVLEVDDDGTGMPEDVRARAFEPFFTTKPVGKGTGLGLSTVYGIVRQAGGVVEIEAGAPRGTIVRTYLPALVPDHGTRQVPVSVLAGATSPSSAPPKPALARVTPPPLEKRAPKAHPRRILLVEDDDAVRMVMARLLGQRGYEVTEATNPDQAVALASTATTVPDLIVTDVVMPQLSGPQLADRVRAVHPTLPILFVSGYSDDVLSARNLESPDVGFLAKPFTTAELFHAVDRLFPGTKREP
jgi:two-component system cell cycle sensor histidine kinase/response regulator CckA